MGEDVKDFSSFTGSTIAVDCILMSVVLQLAVCVLAPFNREELGACDGVGFI